MDDFNVNLTIEDTVRNGCCCSSNTQTILITNSSQTVFLQDCYILNIIFASNDRFTVLIQNGTQVIIRNIFTSFTTDLPLPSNCKLHLLRISGTTLQT